jgi:hypothetical protein
MHHVTYLTDWYDLLDLPHKPLQSLCLLATDAFSPVELSTVFVSYFSKHHLENVPVLFWFLGDCTAEPNCPRPTF